MDSNRATEAASSSPVASPKATSGPERPILSRWFLAAIAGLAVVLLAAVALRAWTPQPLPVLGHVPAFHFVDQRGAPIGSDALLGHPTVVDFIFTRCQSSCPRLTAAMAELQSRLSARGSPARLLSFTVDPENDSPEVLARYAANAHADEARWSFVTGPADEVERAVTQGFAVSAARIARGANEYDVTHGDWFVLVDRRGAIRGYYAMDEAPTIDTLTRDIDRLDRSDR
jgi:protein SCO1/2